MSEAANQIRDRRRAWATPGGSHDRTVRLMATWLPAAIGILVAVMVLSPFTPRGEVSFLLDRNKVAVTRERVRVDNAMYRGTDDKNRAFTVTAQSAVQTSASVPVVGMGKLTAEIALGDGPATLTAPAGAYNYDTETVIVDGDVVMNAAGGYRMVTRNVTIDLNDKRITGSGGVSGAIPAGTFSANRITADLDARTIALEGNARLLMAPGKLRIPQ